MSKIVISYRRNDTRSIAGRLNDYLCDRFGDEKIALGVDSLIKPGDDFLEAVQAGIISADVLVILIGPKWIDDSWLDDPNQFDRIAITAAINEKVRLIPVLVDGAILPSQDSLPSDLKSLSRRAGIELRDDSFRNDVGELVDALKPIISIESTYQPTMNSQQPLLKSYLSVSFSERKGTAEYQWTKAMMPAIIACGATGLVFLVADLIMSPPQTREDLTGWLFLRAIFGAVAGGVAGYGIAKSFRYALPSMLEQQVKAIAIGWAIAWTTPFGVRWLFGFTDTVTAITFIVECLLGTSIMITILNRVPEWPSSKNRVVWGLFMLGYFVTYMVFTGVETDTIWLSALVTALGNSLFAFIATGLSLRSLQDQ